MRLVEGQKRLNRESNQKRTGVTKENCVVNTNGTGQRPTMKLRQCEDTTASIVWAQDVWRRVGEPFPLVGNMDRLLIFPLRDMRMVFKYVI